MLIKVDICDNIYYGDNMKNKIIGVLIAVDTDILEPDFSEGSLLITKKTNHKHINAGDNIFYYDSESSEAIVNVGTVVKKEEVTSTEATLTMQNDNKISMQYVLGKEDAATEIPVLGLLLSILESKWGYMFLVIFPTILITVYEVFAVVSEVKRINKVTKKVEQQPEIEEL